MTVSVIIPTYNRRLSVIEAVRSAQLQTAAAHEIIVVDDGSTDGTREALRACGPDVVVLGQANAGVSAARNAGLRRATGDWVAFLDSDDVWEPGWLATVARVRAEVPAAGLIVADLVFEGPGYRESLFAVRGFTLAEGAATPVSRPLPYALGGLSLIAAAVRRDWMATAGGFDEGLAMYEDLDLLVRLALLGPWALTPFVAARAHRRNEPAGQALTAIAAANQVRARSGLARIFKALLRHPRLSPADAGLVSAALSGAQLGHSKALRTSGQTLHSLAPLLASACSHPSRLKGLSKAALLLVLGPSGYDRATAGKRGFHREDFEA